MSAPASPLSAPAAGTTTKKKAKKSLARSGLSLLSPISLSSRATPRASVRTLDDEIVEISAADFYQRADPTSPNFYENLPYSPQNWHTSGLDQQAAPEASSEEFWAKLLRAWERATQVETVWERRRYFEKDERRVWEGMFSWEE